jgi:hypothetical protein
MLSTAMEAGRRVASNAILSPHKAPNLGQVEGREISGISDVFVKFTPGENISAFDDGRFEQKDYAPFYRQGTSPDVIPGFSAPVSSKTLIEIDLSPNEETTFGMTSRATTADPDNETSEFVTIS